VIEKPTVPNSNTDDVKRPITNGKMLAASLRKFLIHEENAQNKLSQIRHDTTLVSFLISR
jgi:hypothetical protein